MRVAIVANQGYLECAALSLVYLLSMLVALKPRNDIATRALLFVFFYSYLSPQKGPALNLPMGGGGGRRGGYSDDEEPPRRNNNNNGGGRGGGGGYDGECLLCYVLCSCFCTMCCEHLN